MSTATPAWRSWRDPWKAAFFGLAVVALVVGVAWALLGSSLLVVRSVQTTGPGNISRARVLAAAGIKLGTPLIRVDTQAVARQVERVTLVQSARVTRSWPDTVVIWTQRRTAIFAVPSDGRYDLMDAYGVVLRTAAAVPPGLVVMRSPGGPVTALRNNKAVCAAGAVVRALPPWLRGKVRAARTSGSANVILTMTNGATVVWGAATRDAAKARELAILLRTGASYYDVSDPTTAVTRA